jgi:DNA-directed RNA polymerase subunit M/transcription elongation factor TFIIS
MANSCPECGTSMEFEQHDVHLRTGTCPSCAKEFAFVEGTTVSARLGSPPSGSSVPSEGGPEVSEGAEGGPECEECGALLAFREGKDGSLEAVCADCNTTTVFVPQEATRREMVYERPGRERERPERVRERPERFEAGAPRGRPCRKCGAPLRFSTGDDGNLVGECDACGNRFTLPPRAGGGGGGGWGGRGGPRYGRRDFRPGPGARPSYRGREGYRGGRPFGGPERRGPPRDEGEDRRRKRRRRED